MSHDSSHPHEHGESHGGKSYQEEASEFAGSEESRVAAREARRAIDSPEAKEMKKAEKVGKSKARNVNES